MEKGFTTVAGKGLTIAIIAIVFSAFQLVSTYIYHYNSFQFAAINEWTFNLLLLSTFFVFYFFCGCSVYWIIDRFSQSGKLNDEVKANLPWGWIYFLIILLGWSPWLYAFYPGTLLWDMC